MSRSKNLTNLLFSTIAVLTLMAIFIALGFWQLDRAEQVKELQMLISLENLLIELFAFPEHM
jgi:cytochrome oxidase assembly protein ShyY1